MNKTEAQKIFEGANTKSKRALRKRYEELRKELSELLDKTEKIQSRIKITNKIGELDDAFLLLSGKKPYEKKILKKTPVIVTIITIIVIIRAITSLADYFSYGHSENNNDGKITNSRELDRVTSLRDVDENLRMAKELTKGLFDEDNKTKVHFNFVDTIHKNAADHENQ